MTEPKEAYDTEVDECDGDQEHSVISPDTLNPQTDGRNFTISARGTAIGSGIFAVACLTSLAIVAGIKGADGLSTIALALAILAFVIQILVFIAQANSTNHQMLRSEQLNTQTRALLIEMQTTARSTHNMVGEQFGQLLRAFMDAAKEAQGKGEIDQEAFEKKFMENVSQGATGPARSQGSSRQTARTLRRDKDKRYDAGPFPPLEEVEETVKKLGELSRPHRLRLQTYGADKHEVESGVQGYVGFPPGHDERDDELLEKGWIALLKVPPDESPARGLVYRLTDQGVEGAKILNASGPVPDWAKPVVV